MEEGGFARLRAGHLAALTCRRHVIHSRSASNPRFTKAHTKHKTHPDGWVLCLVGEGGFEPPKALPADLQSVPFGHSGIPPYSDADSKGGAGGRIRTPDLLITNQLLYLLSYTSVSVQPVSPLIIANTALFVNKYFSSF